MELKLVRALPGIGEANGNRLNASGYIYAFEIYDKYKFYEGDFITWLKATCGAYENHATWCLDALRCYKELEERQWYSYPPVCPVYNTTNFQVFNIVG